MIKEELFTLTLPYKETEKTVRVFVPEHEDGEKLPVIYMTDGQNIFDDGRPGQFGCWYTREAVRAERELTGKAAIIVGIHNDGSPIERTNELTPASIGEIVPPPVELDDIGGKITPEGEIFDGFVVNTVIPVVESRFPVVTGRNATAFCGSSSGGLQSFFTVMSHPEIFCLSGVFSPAFSLNHLEDLVRFTCEKTDDRAPFLFVYSGAGDPLEQYIFASTENVYDAISEFYPPEKLCEIILPEQGHNERAWEPIFRDFLHTFLSRRENF